MNYFELLTVPNMLTIARGISVFFIIPLWLSGYKELACCITILAYLSDYLDGWWARKYGQVSQLGKILDPIMDKVLFYPILILIFYQDIVIWVAGILFLLDIISTWLRGYYGSGANQFGKWKFGFQIITLTFLGLNGMEWSNQMLWFMNKIYIANASLIFAVIFSTMSVIPRLYEKCKTATHIAVL